MLVVEDDPATREIVESRLGKEGWNVVTATNGKVALDRLQGGLPDLVLLDLMMPEMDGFEFLESFRKHPGCASITVVVMTAKTLTETDHQRLRGKVTQIVQKGSNLQGSLAEEIRSALQATPQTPQPSGGPTSAWNTTGQTPPRTTP